MLMTKSQANRHQIWGGMSTTTKKADASKSERKS